MQLLVLGDVVSQSGCDFLQKKLAAFKRFAHIDVCIANGENAAKGNGLTPQVARTLFSAGVDLITTGNHAFRRREMFDLYDSDPAILRPYNFPASTPGKGVGILDCGRFRVAVINLMGTMYLEALGNPFAAADAALKETDGCRIILVDFHAEATSEKLAMGYYLDGKVSAVVGTHTHVQTSDERVLPGGTGYITDLGMCGAQNTVLGVKKELVIEKFRTHLPVRFDTEESEDCSMEGCIFDIDEKSGLCRSVQRIRLT